ncbi:MAG: alpha/beta hydrolase [Xenococcaceae cyanobacterium MO_188.B19]|nr:alpha/beta hydrolase [Xenococcaceae cyanobacterium MO_188.B19]
MTTKPDFLLFAQHGWSDNGNDIGKLAQAISSPNNLVIAPSLGLLKTYWRIEPLVQAVEKLVRENLQQYPEIPWRIMGHSMGGLIWLEVLQRNPQWWEKVNSLVVIGSPIGGSDIARIIDPLGIGIGMARDLGKNRRSIAEKIAQQIPTISIAGDINGGSDGMVNLTTTKFNYCQFVCLSGIPHATLKRHPRLIPIIQDFWANPQIHHPPKSANLATKIIETLQAIPGMTDGDLRDFVKSQEKIKFSNGVSLHTWKNYFGVNHVFVADEQGNSLYAGYVGWLDAPQLKKVIEKIATWKN